MTVYKITKDGMVHKLWTEIHPKFKLKFGSNQKSIVITISLNQTKTLHLGTLRFWENVDLDLIFMV